MRTNLDACYSLEGCCSIQLSYGVSSRCRSRRKDRRDAQNGNRSREEFAGRFGGYGVSSRCRSRRKDRRDAQDGNRSREEFAGRFGGYGVSSRCRSRPKGVSGFPPASRLPWRRAGSKRQLLTKNVRRPLWRLRGQFPMQIPTTCGSGFPPASRIPWRRAGSKRQLLTQNVRRPFWKIRKNGRQGKECTGAGLAPR